MRTGKEEIYSQLLLIEAVDLEAFEAVSEFLDVTLPTPEGARPRYDQSYQLIAELQQRCLT